MSTQNDDETDRRLTQAISRGDALLACLTANLRADQKRADAAREWDDAEEFAKAIVRADRLVKRLTADVRAEQTARRRSPRAGGARARPLPCRAPAYAGRLGARE